MSLVLTLQDVPAAVCGQWHHVASDKSRASGWTARFQTLFEAAGMTLQDEANLLLHPQHGQTPYAGAHGGRYNQWVYQRLQTAVEGLDGPEYAEALKAELVAIKADLLANPGLLKGYGL